MKTLSRLVALVGITALCIPGAQAQLNTNLILNPGADVDASSTADTPPLVPTSWTATSTAGYLAWGIPGGGPVATDPGPADRGTNFFFGGNDVSTSLTQTISLSSFTALIDSGSASYDLSGWLGGYAFQRDNTVVTATFKDAGSVDLGSAATLGPVTNTDRNNITGLFFRQTGTALPVGTRTVTIQMDFTRVDGAFNDGYADSLSFKVTSAVSSAPEPGTLIFLMLGGTLVLVKRR